MEAADHKRATPEGANSAVSPMRRHSPAPDPRAGRSWRSPSQSDMPSLAPKLVPPLLLHHIEARRRMLRTKANPSGVNRGRYVASSPPLIYCSSDSFLFIPFFLLGFDVWVR
jgi:hypothetical protein